MKQLIYIFMALALIACDTTEDYFSKDNQVPELTIKGSGHSEFARHVADSVKLKTQFYSLQYLIDDETTQTVIIDTDSLSYEQYNDSIVFKVNHTGTSHIKLSVTDEFNTSDNIGFKLICFDNLLPVAKLTIEETEEEGLFLFDASQSYDQDKKYGGKILLYRYTIDSKVIETSKPEILLVLDKNTSSYTISLQVMDNDNSWSEPVSLTVNF